jgi:hypothetical protein
MQGAQGPAPAVTAAGRRPSRGKRDEVKRCRALEGALGLQGGLAETGGAEGNRTPDLLIANEALSQLSYGPDRRAGEYVVAGRKLSRSAKDPPLRMRAALG